MNPTPSLTAEAVRVPARRANPARFLYTGVAAVLVSCMFVGFQLFYLRGQGYPGHPLFPATKSLIVAHGTAMTAWVLLFLAQPLLIATHNRRVHMSVGWAGAAIAVAVVVLGLALPFATTRYEPDIVLWGLHRKTFSAIQFSSVLLFAGFIAVGLRQRQRAAIHRPMMLLGTLAVIGAATDRITALHELFAPTLFGRWFGPYFPAILIGALFIAVKAALTRSFDRWLAGGYAVLVVAAAAAFQFAYSPAWDRFTTWMMG